MSRIVELLRIGKPVSTWVSRTTGVIAAVVFVCGLWSHNSSLLGVGAVVLVTFMWASWCDMTNEFEQVPESRSESVGKFDTAENRLSRQRSHPQPMAKRPSGHPELAEVPAKHRRVGERDARNGAVRTLAAAGNEPAPRSRAHRPRRAPPGRSDGAGARRSRAVGSARRASQLLERCSRRQSENARAVHAPHRSAVSRSPHGDEPRVSAVRQRGRLRKTRILGRRSAAGTVGFRRSDGPPRSALLDRRALSQR